MDQAEVISRLKETESFLEGHFQFSSGLHGEAYVQCARLLQYPRQAEAVCRALADLLPQAEQASLAAVVGPALGGMIIAYELARQLGVKGIFAERQEGVFTLRRGFCLSPGDKVLVAEDVITTGGSVKEVVTLLKAGGVEVVGVACIVDRSGGTADPGAPLFSLAQLPLKNYSPEACPLCRQGIPLVKPGSRPRPG
jgi:orotate phosphoribosyltransferase